MRAERPIVSHPERQSLTQHLTSGTLATIAWAVWLFLWLPTLSAIFWMIGLGVTYKSIVRAPNKSSLLFLLLLVLACNLVSSSWASYNYIRFFGKLRRRGSSAVSHETVGRYFGVTDTATLTLILRERRLNLYFNDAGGLVRAEAVETKDNEEALAESLMV
jgi:poly-beta-1,6-N-acetyl-D-glucosamine biosynthesis protein PgaD